MQGGAVLELNVPDTVKVNKEYNIEITYGTASSCHSLREITDIFTYNSLTINAIICYEQKSGEECMQSPIENTIEKRIVFSKSGSFDVFINDTVFVKQVWVI